MRAGGLHAMPAGAAPESLCRPATSAAAGSSPFCDPAVPRVCSLAPCTIHPSIHPRPSVLALPQFGSVDKLTNQTTCRQRERERETAERSRQRGAAGPLTSCPAPRAWRHAPPAAAPPPPPAQARRWVPDSSGALVRRRTHPWPPPAAHMLACLPRHWLYQRPHQRPRAVPPATLAPAQPPTQQPAAWSARQRTCSSSSAAISRTSSSL